MAKQGKKRVSITVDIDSFDHVTALLNERGYPQGYLSFYLCGCIEDLESILEGIPSSTTALQEFQIQAQLRGKK